MEMYVQILVKSSEIIMQNKTEDIEQTSPFKIRPQKISPFIK